jgi:hypothetical protein
VQGSKTAPNIAGEWKAAKESTEETMKLMQMYKDLGDFEGQVRACAAAAAAAAAMAAAAAAAVTAATETECIRRTAGACSQHQKDECSERKQQVEL